MTRVYQVAGRLAAVWKPAAVADDEDGAVVASATK
jgi:hypothetical protein